jgi:hypothetical protein
MSQNFRKSISPVVKLGKQLTLHPIIRSTTVLTPISEHLEEDIFIVGYPKSGNTWFQNLVAGVVYGMNPLYSPDTLVQELVPDVHQKRYYKRFWTPMFFKSHLLPQPDYKRVIYLLRDGRDAMVSYFHFLTALKGHELDFAEMVKYGEGLYCKWHVHVDAWMTNPYGAETLTISYEDLKNDTVRELQRFCNFVDVDRDPLWLKEVAENAAFEKMQNKEKAGQIYMDNPLWPKDKLFNRRGVVGSYKDEMPPQVLELFLQDAQETLARCGYLD